MTFEMSNNNNNNNKYDKVIKSMESYVATVKTVMEQHEQQQQEEEPTTSTSSFSSSSSSYFPTPVLKITKIPKTNIRFVPSSLSTTNHHDAENNNNNINNHDPICPIEFDWYDTDNNKNESIDSNNNDQHNNINKQRRYVKISRIYHDSLYLQFDNNKNHVVSNQDNSITTATMKDNNMRVGQIIVWMNNYHITSPQQAKEIVIQCCDDRNNNNMNHPDNFKKDNDNMLSYLTIVTCDADDIILRSKQLPFLKLCIVSNNHTIPHDSGCDFAYINMNSTTTSQQQKQQKNKVHGSSSSSISNNILYVSSIDPKGLWVNTTLQCGDIILSMNGYTIMTKNDIKHAIMKSYINQSSIIYYLYVIDFIQFQYYIYQHCIQNLLHTRKTYPYQVQFHYDHCCVESTINNNQHHENSTFDKHNSHTTTCQIVFYNDHTKNDNNGINDVKKHQIVETQTTSTKKQPLLSSQTTTTFSNDIIMIASTKIDIDIWKNIINDNHNLYLYHYKKTGMCIVFNHVFFRFILVYV